jgi:hypothetical protein
MQQLFMIPEWRKFILEVEDPKADSLEPAENLLLQLKVTRVSQHSHQA